MDIEKLIERLRSYTYWLGQDGPESHDIHPLICDEAADALSTIPTLQAENAKLRAELEQVKRLYQSEKEDFIEFACSGIPNLSPFCFNRHPDCVDERGWCKTEKCRGFSRERRPEEG